MSKKEKKKLATPYDEIDELNILAYKKVGENLNKLRLKLSTKKNKNLKFNDFLEETDLIFYLLLDVIEKNYYKSAKEIYGDIKKDDVKKFLEEYYIVTKYAFYSEWQRKATRHAEALYSIVANGKSLSSSEALKAQKTTINLLNKQIDEYGVYIVDRAIKMKAENETGTKLRWKTEEDENVCPICKSRRDKIYTVKEYPAKPHWHCRCYPEIVRKEK